MMPRADMKTDTNITLPLSFIVYGLIALILSQFILFFSSSSLLSGQFRIPEIWMSAHFLLLGFALMVAMGAMYQLVPVAFLVQIWNEKFGFVQFFMTAFGILFLSAMLGIKPNFAVYGGILTVIGMFMFLLQMERTMKKVEKKSMMYYFVIASLSFLLLAILAGFLLVWNFAFGGIPNHEAILYTHMTFGVAGWFTLLIFGFSYKLVPMFSLSHGFSMKRAKPSLIIYIAGLSFLVASFWLPVSFLDILGWMLLWAGFGLFVLDIKEILQKRVKKKLDKPFIFSLIAIGSGFLIHTIALGFSLFAVHHRDIWSWLIFLYIMIWIIFSIIGYLYKIVPFLWWTHKYADRIGKEKVPTLKEMMNEKLSIYLFILFSVAIIGIIISFSFASGKLLFIFLGILAFTSLVYGMSIIKVLVQ